MRLTAAVTREGRWYVARCLEVEVASQGQTLEDALSNLQEALALYFEDNPMAKAGDPPIIAPAGADLMPHSGADIVRVLVRIGFHVVGQRGSHVKLRRVGESGQLLTVIVPMHREIARGTLASIA